MDFLRSKELKDAMHLTHQLFTPSDGQAQEIAKSTVDCLVKKIRQHKHAEISSGILHDTHLLPWLERQMHFMGSKALVHEMMHFPLTNPEDIALRQNWIRSQPNVQRVIADLAAHETDVLWALRLPDIKKAWPMPLLFPCWPVVHKMNRIPWVTEFYQIYRLYFAPTMNLIYPASVFFGPWWYLKYKLKWNISLNTYVGFLANILRELFRLDLANLKQSLARILTFAAYILIYVYTIVQSVDIALMLHRVRQQLRAKLKSICTFVAEAERLVCNVPRVFFEHFGVCDPGHRPPKFSTNMATMYNLWTSGKHRDYLTGLLHKIYVINVISMARSWMEQRSSRWSFVHMDPLQPFMIHKMKNPVLPPQQQSNPLKLAHNLIITGPNAAGKTTYVKSILCNVLLSQTLGVSYATECTTPIFHTIASFMRINDQVGRESLFEAEVHRCLKAINDLKQDLKHEKRAIVLLDEPMHSTPPIEGAAAAMAFIKQISEIPGVRSITTTHFFPITALEKECAGQFINVGFDAKSSKKRILFTYKVRRGPSFQCIALDLLRQKRFPKSFILDAIKFKNKICP
jgi:hypothetical protein